MPLLPPCPKIGLNYLSGWFISLKSEDMKTLGLKLNLGMDKPDSGVAVGTSVQKVGLIILADGLFP